MENEKIIIKIDHIFVGDFAKILGLSIQKKPNLVNFKIYEKNSFAKGNKITTKAS